MAYAIKDRDMILRHALEKLQEATPVTSIGAGSVARSLAEAITTELGDFYSILEFNVAQGFISTAQGRALDLLGELYQVERRQISEIATTDQTVGSFYFFIDSPHNENIIIPPGIRVFTDSEGFIGETFTYLTIVEAVIPAGRLRAYTSLRPEFADSVFTAGAHTLTQHNLEQPDGVTVKCTNPKAIAAQIGFESDDNYRARIIKEIRRAAGGTVEAVRFAGLSVSGVREVTVRNAPYGLGSLEALVVPEEIENAPQVTVRAFEEMERVRPVGVRMFVREPEYVNCDIEATIILRDNVNVDPEGTASRAEIGILRYLNTLLPGRELVFTQLIQSILDASDAILDVFIGNMRMNAIEVLRRNFKPDPDEQIVPGLIEVRPAS